MRYPNGYEHKGIGPPRCAAEYLGGTKVRFTFPCCGHSFVKDYSKGPRPRRLTADGVRFLARYWRKENGGVGCGWCPRCLPDSASIGLRGGKKPGFRPI